MKTSEVNKWWEQKLKLLFLIMLWFVGGVFVLLCFIFSDFKWLGKGFCNWWSCYTWRWSNVVKRSWRGHTAWLSSLADAWGVAERSKLSAALDKRLSMEREERDESGGKDMFLERPERSEVSLFTLGHCAMKLETNLEVDYKQWFCLEPSTLVFDLQQNILGWEFRGK